MQYGAYDPLYPNGIVSVSSPKEIFGLRFLAADQESHQLMDGKALDFSTIRIKPNKLDQHYDFTWSVNGKQLHLTWCRLSEKMIYGHLSFEEGLEVVAELYIPWENRLDGEWPNFTRQGTNLFAGELISPYHTYPDNAVLFGTDITPIQALGYPQRAEQLEDFRTTGTLRNIAPGTIWRDMGISWFLGAHFTQSFSFTLQNGSAKEFSSLLEENQDTLLEEFFRTGQKKLEEKGPVLTGTGILNEIGEAFSSLLPYNTVYKAHTDRRYIMVDRP